MNLRNTPTLAKQRLSQPGWWKLFGLHAAVSLGAGLLVSLLGLFLTAPEATSLGGMDTRMTLESIRSLLESAITLALPFWEIGLVYLSLQYARKESASCRSLLQGFRRFAPVLRLLVMKFLILLGVTFGMTYIMTAVIAARPETAEAAALLTPMLESDQMIELEPVLSILVDTMLPLLLIFAGLFLLVWLFVTFRLRWTEYAIMSDDTFRATAAIRGSWSLTKTHFLPLLKLDLRFWWIYLLDGLVLAIFFLEWVLSAVGVPLPLDPGVFSWLMYGLYLVLRLLVSTFLYPRMKVTYALAYDALTQRLSEE